MIANPLRLRFWLVLAIALTCIVVAVGTGSRPSLSTSDWVLVAAFLAVLIVIERMDVAIPLSSTTFKVSVGSSVALAAVMALDVGIGCLIVLTGHLVDSILAKRDPIKAATNIASYVTASIMAGLAYHSLADTTLSPVSSFQNIGASLAASMIHVSVSTLLMAVIVAPIIGMPLLSFLRSAMRLLATETVAMPAVSGLIVLAAAESAGTVLLLAFPLLGPQVAYRTLGRAQRSVRDTLENLSDILEQRDPYTANHSVRVASMVRATLAEMPDIPYDLTETIVAAARVHDIGKIGARDISLFKPGPLTTEERHDIQRHTVIGSDLLANTHEYRLTATLVRHHHENWNGSGYPDRLAGQDIPLGSRVIAVADAFDAMTTDRPYRTAMPFAVALDELRRHSGTQFDPQVVSAFLTAMDAEPISTQQSAGAARAAVTT